MKISEILEERAAPGIRERLIFCAILISAVFLTYGGMISAPLESDAKFLTYDNSFVASSGGLWKIWTSDFFGGAVTGTGFEQTSGYYRPVTNTILRLEYMIAGENDSFYNFFQQLLHGFNACLVFFTALRLFRFPLMAVLTSLLFALHPINAFVATQVASASDSLFFTFYIAAMWAYSTAILSKSSRTLKLGTAAAVIFYLLSIMSKEMGATLPMELLLVHVYLYYSRGMSLKRAVWTLPFWFALTLYFIWRLGYLGIWPQSIGYTDYFPAYVVYLNLLKNVLIYILRILVPHGAEYDELFPSLFNFIDESVSDPLIYLSLLFIFLLASFAVVLRKRSPESAFLFMFFLVTLAPLAGVNNISGTLNIGEILVQERWVYLPGMGLFMLLGLGGATVFEKVKKSDKKRFAFASASLLVFILLSSMSTVHAKSVNSEMAQLSRYYLRPPEKLGRLDKVNMRILYANLVAIPMGDLDEAEKMAKEAVELAPDSPYPAFALGRVYFEKKEYQKAVRVLREWIEVSGSKVNELHKTNFRIVDDIHRTNGQIAVLFGRSLAHLGYGRDSAYAFCLALKRNFPERGVANGLAENYALNGPERCLSSTNREKCVNNSPPPPFPQWNAPLKSSRCEEWPDLIEKRG